MTLLFDYCWLFLDSLSLQDQKVSGDSFGVSDPKARKGLSLVRAFSILVVVFREHLVQGSGRESLVCTTREAHLNAPLVLAGLVQRPLTYVLWYAVSIPARCSVKEGLEVLCSHAYTPEAQMEETVQGFQAQVDSLSYP